MRSARNLYRVNLGLAGLGLLAVLAGAFVALRGVELDAPPAARLVAYCQRFVLPDLTPGSLLVLALGALGVVVAVRATRSLLRQVGACRRFLRRLETIATREVAGSRVLVVRGAAPEAFCAGFVRPRIYLSHAALEVLAPEELEAVVAHECHHARRRDPLRILLVGVLADALFFLPALRRLKVRYEQLAELAADEAAVATHGGGQALAAALLRFGDRGAPGVVVGIAPERVDHLLGDVPRWELPLSLVLGTLVTVAGLVALAVVAAHATASAGVSLAVIAAQSCMITMVALPIFAVAGLALVGGRAITARLR